MREITFTVKTGPEGGILVASWDNPGGGGITTQAESKEKLYPGIEDAVGCYFDEGELPDLISVHFEKDVSLSLLGPVSREEVTIALRDAGFGHNRDSVGSHSCLSKDSRRIVVPKFTATDTAPNPLTLASILRQADLTSEDFYKLLQSSSRGS